MVGGGLVLDPQYCIYLITVLHAATEHNSLASSISFFSICLLSNPCVYCIHCSLGLVSKIVPNDKLVDAALEMANHIGKKSLPSGSPFIILCAHFSCVHAGLLTT